MVFSGYFYCPTLHGERASHRGRKQCDSGEKHVDIFERIASDRTENNSTDGGLLGRNTACSPGRSEIFQVLQNERRQCVLQRLNAVDSEGNGGESAVILTELESDEGINETLAR